MVNPRIDKINSEIAKTKTRITESQAKLRLLERQKIDLENDSFINIIRSERISDAELSALMESLRKAKPRPESEPKPATANTKEKTRLEDYFDADHEKI
jgi:septal ring factor EnvC (AmiA/AmiB activator)